MADGWVYVLHVDPPYNGRFGHYVGHTFRSVAVRLVEHRNGEGCKWTARAKKAGCSFYLGASWPGSLRDEQWVKVSGGGKRFCDICQREG
jgi:predicted GIY-YIG superfamily endonuclease